MAITPITPRTVRTLRSAPSPVRSPSRTQTRNRTSPPRRIAKNFAALSLAEIACRCTSVAVTLYLAKRLDTSGFGRIEFAFNVVFWLVLLVREGFDVIASREIARHPQLIRPLVNHVLAIRGMLALGLLGMLLLVGRFSLSEPTDRAILGLYGLMLVSTALGLDFVYRGIERMGLVAVSLVIRTVFYASGVALLVGDASRIVWVPACLFTGEMCGISLIWFIYIRQFGVPRPALRGDKFLRVFLRRGRPVYMIQISQAVIGSVDLLIVGMMSGWSNVGLYSAPHRMVTAILTFGLIFQQVIFPSLARTWRDTPESGRRMLDVLVRVLVLVLLPMAVGASVLSSSLVRYLFRDSYAQAALLLAVGIWRAPLLALAYLYQTTLIALNRESAGVRLLVAGAIGSGPLVAAFHWWFGLPGAAAAVVLIGFSLAFAGHRLVARTGREPVWHHHLGRPLAASIAMVPVCLMLRQVHVLLAIGGGALTYFAALSILGGLRKKDLRTLLNRN